jgi:ribonuclease R
MTYEEIDKINNWEISKWYKLMFWGKVTKQLINLTKNSFSLSDKIWSFLKNNWELEINSTETKIVVDEEKNPIWVKAYPKYHSNDLIKNMMVIANNVVPQLIEEELKKLWFEKFPFVFRTHWAPEEKAVEKLENVLRILGVEYDFSLDSPSWFSKILDQIKWHPKEKFLTKRITITLQKAIYSAVKEWHFWLALEYYSHFTSPIRRYSDTQIHRIIKEIINWTFDKQKYLHYLEILPDVTQQCSIMEDIAEKNESDINKYLWFELLKDKIWEKFSWYIDDISPKKVKIVLDNTILWTLSLEYFDKYYFEKLFDWVYQMKNLEDNSIIELWDRVEVLLDSINNIDKELYFCIINN